MSKDALSRAILALVFVVAMFRAAQAETQPPDVRSLSPRQLFNGCLVRFTPGESSLVHDRRFDSCVELRSRDNATADFYLTEMLNYYLGATDPTESIIVKRGSRMLPLLQRIKKRGPHCDPRFGIQCQTKTDLIERVDDAIESIRRRN